MKLDERELECASIRPIRLCAEHLVGQIFARVRLHHRHRRERLLERCVNPAFDLLLLVTFLRQRAGIAFEHPDQIRHDEHRDQRQRPVESEQNEEHADEREPR